MEVEERGSVRGIKRSFLETRLEAAARQGNWDLFNQTLALSIYGLILFPFTPNLVDQATMDVFFKAHFQGQNPIPAILGDTFLSLGVCQQNNGGRLRCCSQILYVWFMTHVYADRRRGPFTNPLTDFHRIIIKQQRVEVWKQEFSEIHVNSFKWVCPWYHGEKFIYSCGSFNNVPLMGPRGCSFYMPALVLRQLHFTQTKPQEDHLDGCHFLYQKDQDTRKQEELIKDAWKEVRLVGKNELGQQRATSSEEYREWRKERMGSDYSSKKTAPTQMQDISQPNSQVEIMKAQMRFLEEKKQASDVEIVILQDRCEKMAREIELLKNENIKSKKRKEPSLPRIQELEEALTTSTKERSKLEKEIEKRKKILVRVEAEVYKRDDVILKLKKEIKNENEARRQLEEEVARIHSSARRYQRMFVEATNFGNSFRKEALQWKEKHSRLTGELSHYVPNLVYRFEKANEQMNKMSLFSVPQEVTEFMEYCGCFARSLKRKERRSLM